MLISSPGALRSIWVEVAACSALLGMAGMATAQTSVVGQALENVDQNVDKNLEVDFLFNYYDQDGDHSPVTGGIGTEDQQVVGPVFLVRWDLSEKWALNATLGADNVTSASTDNIDDNVSSASRLDNRVFLNTNFVRSFGSETSPQRVGFSLGFSKEYDYVSNSVGLSWSREFNERNTAVSAAVSHYMDTIDLYDIDGIVQGEDDRTTTDFSLGISQILGRKTIASLEFSHSMQDGFLSTPFHEVILTDGSRVAERFPGKRSRTAIGARLNHAFTDRIVGRLYVRYYDDDFEVSAQTIEFEPHFRLPTKREAWVYPILRFHSQDGASFFGLPGTFTSASEFYTADRDLGDFDSEKLGIGFKIAASGTRAAMRGMRDIEFRLARYERADGLEAMNLSIGFGWSFR